jgi:hypothetical protein
MNCVVSHEYGGILFGAVVSFSAPGSGRRTSCELKRVLAIYMQIEHEDG